MSGNVHQTCIVLSILEEGIRNSIYPPGLVSNMIHFQNIKRQKYAFLKVLRKSYDQYESSITRKFEIDM